MLALVYRNTMLAYAALLLSFSLQTVGSVAINSIRRDPVKNDLLATTHGVRQSSSNEPYTTGSYEKSENLTTQEFITTESPWSEICTKGEIFRQRSESILNYLLRMQSCDTLQDTKRYMDKVCLHRTFAYNEYYKVAYLRWCNNRIYREVCLQRKSLPQPKSMESDLDGSGDFAAENEDTRHTFVSNMDEKMLEQACSEVEDFMFSFAKSVIRRPRGRSQDPAISDYVDNNFAEVLKSGNSTIPVVRYSEWFFNIIPFCDAFTCGASYEKHSAEPFSMYDCMPKRCRAMIAFSIFFDAILAVLTIIANALVLGVAARTKIMRNIPGYFKISLALADLTVGLFVLPSCIYTTYALYMRPLPFRHPGQKPSLEEYMSRHAANFIGFFVVLSFAVSVYTMAGASIDRYLAITKPFQYRQGQYLTKKRSAIAFILIWLISFAVAIFPVFTTAPYSNSAFNLILSSGVGTSIVYAIALLIPLIAVWSLNGAMLKQVCADREKRSSIRASSVISAGGAPPNFMKKDSLTYPQQAPTRHFSNSENHLEDVPELSGDEDKGEVIKNGGAHPETEKKVVTRNVSNNSVFQKKRSPLPAADGAVGRINRHRAKQSIDSLFHRKSTTRMPNGPNSAASVERRLARTLAIMIGAFTLALLPNIATLVAYIVQATDTSPGTSVRLASALYISSRILLSNSFWNCIIYSIRNRHFRRAMWAIFLCKKEKIDRKLRQSVTMSQQWRQRSHSGSMHHKPSLSKTSSCASSHGSDKTRRSTLFLWSFGSNSPGSSRKSSADILSTKEPVGRSVSCFAEAPKAGILKKTVGRSESAPHSSGNHLSVPEVTINAI